MAQTRNKNGLTARQQARSDRKLIKSGTIITNQEILISKLRQASTDADAFDILQNHQKESVDSIKPWKIKPYGKNPLKVEDVTSDLFLESFEWRRLRIKALQINGRTCQCCGADPSNGAILHVDHIKPRKFFPELALDINNLQVLCNECNHGKGNWNFTDFRTSFKK